MDAHAILRRYYDAFIAGDREGFLELLTDDVVHDINQGRREVGKDAFRAFMARMDRCYREQIVGLVTLASADARRASAEFMVEGTYLATDEGMPPARGQSYRLPAGAFFELRDEKVARVTVYYNVQDWLRQIGG